MSDNLPKAEDFLNKRKALIRESVGRDLELAFKYGGSTLTLKCRDEWFLDELDKAGWDIVETPTSAYIKLPGTPPPDTSVLRVILFTLFGLYAVFFVVAALIRK